MLKVKVWKKTTLTKEEIEKAINDDQFQLYVNMLIEKLVERRLEEKLFGKTIEEHEESN